MNTRGSMLIVAAFAAAAGCGGDALSHKEFADRLQAIKQRESARFAGLAQQAERVKSDQAIPPDVKQAMTEVAAGHRRAADELAGLEPPDAAEDATVDLIAALRERAAAFERAARQEGITLRQIEQDGRSAAAGDRIDEAFERLSRAGFRVAPAPEAGAARDRVAHK